jgi:hypothetical protein
MDRIEMMKRIESGESLIDITIDKWKDVVNGTGFCLGMNNCALCYVYANNRCENCLIRKFTGFANCDNTPFRDWYRHYMSIHYDKDSDVLKCPICKDIARREVEFLIQVKSAFL